MKFWFDKKCKQNYAMLWKIFAEVKNEVIQLRDKVIQFESCKNYVLEIICTNLGYKLYNIFKFWKLQNNTLYHLCLYDNSFLA